MKPKPFAALAVATVLALAIAIATYTAQNRWSQAKVSGAALFPSLAADSRITGKFMLTSFTRLPGISVIHALEASR